MYRTKKIIDDKITIKYQEFKVFNEKEEFKIVRDGSNIKVFETIDREHLKILSLKEGSVVISNMDKQMRQELLEICCSYHCSNC